MNQHTNYHNQEKHQIHRTSKKADKYLLISVHDVTPFYEKELCRIFEELNKRKISKITLLITPNWNQEWNLNKYPGFVKKIKKIERRGAELALHGYDHDDEFSRTQKHEDAKKILKNSMRIFKKAFQIEPKGYIPPMWAQSKAMYSLVKNKFNYTESFTELEYFNNNSNSIKIKGFPIGMEGRYSENDKITPMITKTLSIVYSKIIWNNSGVVRYSIHPRETKNGNFDATLKLLDEFLKQRWKPMTYSGLNKLYR